jgi:ABC-type lipoprotein release transport system permease subunit
MAHQNIRPRKRSLSSHQKQIRFIIGLAVIVGVAFTVLILWVMNGPVHGIR